MSKVRDLSKSYVWYSKDWGSDEKVFNLSPAERGLYRELIDLAYAHNNHIPLDVQLWARRYNATVSEIDKILVDLEVKNLIKLSGEYITIFSVNKRLKSIKNGKKGGLQKAKNQAVNKGGTTPTTTPTTTHTTRQYKDKDKDKDIYIVVSYLNDRAQKSFKITTEKTRSVIRARLNDGYTVQDLQTVVDIKCDQWKGHADFDKFLRPVTLFGNKFESYLNEKPISVKQVKHPKW